MEYNNYLIDCPNDIKFIIFDKSNYITKIILYLFCKEYDYYINIKSLDVKLNRYISTKELKLLISIDNSNLFNIIENIDPPQFYLDKFIKITYEYNIFTCCKLGSIDILKYLLNNNSNISDENQILACYLCIKNNHFDCLKLLKLHNFKWGSNIFLACAKSNNLELFDKMLKSDLYIDEHLVSDKVEYNIKDEFFINSCHIRKNLIKIFNAICRNCNIKFLEYILNLYNQITSDNISKCINKKSDFYSQTKMINWAQNKFIPLNNSYCNRAASTGNLELLVWLRKLGFPWDKEILINAYKGDNVLVLDYILKNSDFKISSNIYTHIINSKNENFYKYLMNDESYIFNTILRNDIKEFADILTRIDKSILTKEILLSAINSSNEQFILELLKKDYYSNYIIENYNIYFKLLIDNNKIESIKLLDKLHNIGNLLTYTINTISYDIFLWYIDKYNSFLKEDINKIIIKGNLKLLEWMIDHDADIFIIKECIIKNKKFEYSKYIQGILTSEDYIMMQSSKDESNLKLQKIIGSYSGIFQPI